MKPQSELRKDLESGALDDRLMEVYGCDQAELPARRARLAGVLDAYGSVFGSNGPAGIFSGPGRTELGGNHTDHQHGRVLAAAVELDTIACAGTNGSGEIRIISKGYPEVSVNLASPVPLERERGTSAALVRGIAARISALGYPVSGFCACVESNVLGGSGLSSSAAYEVLIGVIINHLFCGDALSMIQIAQIGQYAENVFFGKPCGLMDQLTSAVGGIVAIDFRNPETPAVRKLEYRLSDSGYALCIIDSGADHADLTDEYAAIPGEMHSIADYFGKSVLRDVDEADFWASLTSLRLASGDRAVLRAIHFFTDDRLAEEEAQALSSGNFQKFLALVRRSGESSALHLQNLSCAGALREQALPVTIAAAEHLLRGDGAVRVHGGGFAGTVQAYVPFERTEEFRVGMETLLGGGCCHFLRIRPVGGAVLA